MSRAPNPDDVAIGARLRAYRMSAGLGQERLGAALGITFQQIQKYEKGTNRISGSRILQIARVLDINPAALLADGGDAVVTAIAQDAARMSIADAGVVRLFCELPAQDRRRVEKLVEALHAANDAPAQREAAYA